jgi:general secretion pathway protein D
VAVVLYGVASLLMQSGRRVDAAGLCPSGSGTLVCVQPAAGTGVIAQPLLASVAVRNAADLGAFQFALDYDPAFLTLNSAVSAPFLSSSGRIASCTQLTASGHVSIACVTQGPEPPPGVDGDGVLVDLAFTPVSGGVTNVVLSNVILTTPGAVASSPATQNATVTIDGATPTPCAGTCPTGTPVPTNTPVPTPPGTASIALNPASASVNVGDVFTLSVDVTGAQNLAAFQFTLQLTGGHIELQSAAPGPLLGSTGRAVFCPPVQASLSVVTFGCVTNGAGIPGASGNGVLAQLTFRAVSTGAGSLTFVSVSLADPLSDNLPSTSTGGAVLVGSGATATSTPCPGACPTATPSPTPPPPPTPVAFPTTCSASGAVCVQPGATSVLVGDSFTVGVVASGVTDLGAYQFELDYNPAIVTVQSIANATFLGSTGRIVLCAAPIVASASVRLACSTLGPEPPAGPSGSGVLAVVTFQAVGPGTSSLSLTNTELTTPSNGPISVSLISGSVTVSAATPTPCAGPCPTPTSTFTPTATSTPAPISCPSIAATVVCIVPPSQLVSSGSTLSIDLVVDNVVNLAAFQVEVQYDPTLLTYVSATNGVFLGSTGRSTFCPPIILNLTSFVFSCASIGPAPLGPNGTGILFHVTFQATSNTGISPLTLLQFDLTDPLANAIPDAAVGGSVEVQ